METLGSALKSAAQRLGTGLVSWPQSHGSGSLKQALADRLILSEALELVGRMVDAIPNGRASIGDSYLGAVSNLLCQYPRSIAIECADPVRGVMRTTRFVPTICDVAEWCDPRLADLGRRSARIDQRQAQLDEREEFDRKFPPRRTLSVDIDPEPGSDGKHPPGTILSNYDEAFKLYGRPIGRFEPGREKA